MKKINKRAKGNRNLKKTIDLLISQGYWVEKTEVLKMAWVRGKVIPVRTDILKADCVAIKNGVMSIIQIKSNKNDVRIGMANLKQIPPIKEVKKEVWLWNDRSKEPVILKCEL